MSRITLTLEQLPPMDEPLQIQVKNTFVELEDTSDDWPLLDANPRRMLTDSVLCKNVTTGLSRGTPIGVSEFGRLDAGIKDESETPTTASDNGDEMGTPMSASSQPYGSQKSAQPHGYQELNPAFSIPECEAPTAVPLAAHGGKPPVTLRGYQEHNTMVPVVAPQPTIAATVRPDGIQPANKRAQRPAPKSKGSRGNAIKASPIKPIGADSLHGDRCAGMIPKFCHQCGYNRDADHVFCARCGVRF